jgi:hypothetical protein
MKKSYHESARTQDPQFLGAPQAAAEDQRLSALCEPDASLTGEAAPVNRHPLPCPICSGPLLLRLYAKGRGFQLVCRGTNSNPHKFEMHYKQPRKGDALLLLSSGRISKWLREISSVWA